jgi:23S rRNA pseudouridine2605 synthase
MEERLQKIISRAGIASRRHAEQLILSGAVSVNGHVVTELGTKADAAKDHINVGPRTVRIADAPERYLAFYKPAQVVSTMNDPEQRPSLGPYLRGSKGRLFPVGRLDFDAAGLLLLTSDGALASDLMRGAALVPQTWRLKVKGRIAGDAQQRIERAAGVRPGGLRMHRDAKNAWYEAELAAGGGPRDKLGQALLRNGVLVEKMLRWRYGGVSLDELAPGEMRELTSDELRSLRRSVAGRLGQIEKRNSIPKFRDEKRKPSNGGRRAGISQRHEAAEGKGAAAPERPERVARARGVDQWRAVHGRGRRGAVGPARAAGQAQSRSHGRRKNQSRNRGRRAG